MVRLPQQSVRVRDAASGGGGGGGDGLDDATLASAKRGVTAEEGEYDVTYFILPLATERRQCTVFALTIPCASRSTAPAA